MTVGRLRWLAPLGVLGASALVAVSPVLSASAAPELPHISAKALLTKALSSRVQALAGEVEVSTDLGLPSAPAGSIGGSDALLSAVLAGGTQTLKVWQDGPGRSRVAWLQSGAEQDLYVDGATAWSWDSATRTAEELTAPAGHAAEHGAPSTAGRPTTRPTTPGTVAADLLAHLSPTTSVRVGPSTVVAGRTAYQLLLAPRQSATLVGQVVLDVDSATGLVLGVSVQAVGQKQPALSVSYRRLSLTAPAASVFAFSPPAGATVHRMSLGGRTAQLGSSRVGSAPAAGTPTEVGTGWTTVVEIPKLALSATERRELDLVTVPDQGGRLLSSSLLTGYLSPDGTLYLGAVTPARLLAAAGG
jgi:outer membrane lipoprotein-sorting protein